MKPKKEIIPWEKEEVYAYKLDSDYAREKGLHGRYFLLQKIDEFQISPRVIAPIVYVKITKDDTLPKSFEEYDRLEYVQTRNTKYENRFMPYDFSRLEEDIAEKSKLTYEINEYGFLPQFRALLILAAGKKVPSDLEYVGKFENVTRPSKEFVPHIEFHNRIVVWKKTAEFFDKIMIDAYYGHNLRTLEIYQTK